MLSLAMVYTEAMPWIEEYSVHSMLLVENSSLCAWDHTLLYLYLHCGWCDVSARDVAVSDHDLCVVTHVLIMTCIDNIDKDHMLDYVHPCSMTLPY